MVIFLIFRQAKTLNFISKNAIISSFSVVLVATLGSLFYSEVAGYEACKLCWFQRIFMYPQVILLFVIIWKKKAKLLIYNSLPLSIIGALISAYHYFLQIGVISGFSCEVVGYSVACSQRFVMTFSYISIPMMAFTAFMLIIFLSIIKLKNIQNKEKTTAS